MLHLLIRSQLGYLLHPSIKLPSAIKNQKQLRIADVGTGTGYVNHATNTPINFYRSTR